MEFQNASRAGASRDRNGWVGTRARRGEETGGEGRGARTGHVVNARGAYLDLLGGELELPDVARGEVPPGTLVVELHLAPAGCDAHALGERGGARPARPAGFLDAHRDRARPVGEWAVRRESCGPPRDAREGVRLRARANLASWLASCDGCASKTRHTPPLGWPAPIVSRTRDNAYFSLPSPAKQPGRGGKCGVAARVTARRARAAQRGAVGAARHVDQRRDGVAARRAEGLALGRRDRRRHEQLVPRRGCVGRRRPGSPRRGGRRRPLRRGRRGVRRGGWIFRARTR